MALHRVCRGSQESPAETAVTWSRRFAYKIPVQQRAHNARAGPLSVDACKEGSMRRMHRCCCMLDGVSSSSACCWQALECQIRSTVGPALQQSVG